MTIKLSVCRLCGDGDHVKKYSFNSGQACDSATLCKKCVSVYGGASSDELRMLVLLANGFHHIVSALGLDLSDKHLVNTPGRIARSWVKDFFWGLWSDPSKFLKVKFAEESYDQMIVQSKIPFVSFCMHHFQPFSGFMDVGYVPKGRVLGLSKIPRLVDCLAHRPTIQERLTHDVAEYLWRHLKPRGVMVVARAEHGCLSIRGAKAAGSITVTSAIKGVFRDPAEKAREEFLALIHSGGK